MIMSNAVDTTLQRLESGQMLRISDGAGTLVTAVAGTVWITQDGDAEDIILESGVKAGLESGLESGSDFVVDRDGLVLVSALGGDAEVSIAAPAGLPLAA